MNPTVPSWLVGMLRALGLLIFVTVVKFFANEADLTPFVGGATAGTIGIIALSLEHVIESQTGLALFGAIRTRPKNQS